MSGPRRARHIVHLVAVAVSLAVAAPAFAQKPSVADIDRMLPSQPDDHAFPSYKWMSGAPIQPLIVTGGQEGACVDAAFSRLSRQIDRIRDFVPSLRNMEDPELIDWPPPEPVDAPLLIGLASKSSAIEQAISTYGQIADLRAESHHLGRRTGMMPSFGEGYGIRDARITYAYAWMEDATGVSASEASCGDSVRHTTSLRALLGAGRFRVFRASSPQDKSAAWQEFMDRLFVRALYACPGSPVSDDCLKIALGKLIADPSLEPEGWQ